MERRTESGAAIDVHWERGTSQTLNQAQWVSVPQIDPTDPNELKRACERLSMSNEQLLDLAAKNPPPQSWWEVDENPFEA